MSQPRQERALRAAPSRPERRYIAVDDDVLRVLAGHRGAALLYGTLATAWYEFASPEKARERERKGLGRPGDFIPLTYRTLQDRTGDACIASIAQWIRELAERAWPCPWGCEKQHPLIVVKRQGLRAPNLYRRWRCADDTVVALRRPIRRPRKAIAASQPPLSSDNPAGSQPAPLPSSILETRIQGSSLQHSGNQNPSARITRIPVVDGSESRDSSNQNHQYGSEPRLEHRAATAPVPAAAIEEADEVDAVACEIVEALLALAQRIEPDYPDDRAWAVARRLASAVLEQSGAVTATARAALLRAIADRRLARAKNPIGLLIRGVVGDEKGGDRYLLVDAPLVTQLHASTYQTSTGLPPGLHDSLLDSIRRGLPISETWLRERDISAEALKAARAELKAEVREEASSNPLCDKLEKEDPATYHLRLERILADLELPTLLRIERRLDHPMLLGMCRARLEIGLVEEQAKEQKGPMQ